MLVALHLLFILVFSSRLCILALQVHLLVQGPLLLLGHSLVHVEDSRDIELHAVQVRADHRPELEKTRPTRLCYLREESKDREVLEGTNREMC